MILIGIALLFLASLLHGWYAGHASVPISRAAIGYMYYRGYVIAVAAVCFVVAVILLWLSRGIWWAVGGAASYFLFLSRITWRILVALGLVPVKQEFSN